MSSFFEKLVNDEIIYVKTFKVKNNINEIMLNIMHVSILAKILFPQLVGSCTPTIKVHYSRLLLTAHPKLFSFRVLVQVQLRLLQL